MNQPFDQDEQAFFDRERAVIAASIGVRFHQRMKKRGKQLGVTNVRVKDAKYEAMWAAEDVLAVTENTTASYECALKEFLALEECLLLGDDE